MFEASDLELVAEMCSAQRAERVALARRVLAAGRLFRQRTAGLDDDERALWCIDNWEITAADVGAALGVSRAAASTQMNYGVELLEKFPNLAVEFAAGEVEFRVIASAVFRIGLVTDPAILARLDAWLARRAPRLNRWGRKRLDALFDSWVCHLDPAAQRRARDGAQSRGVEFGTARDGVVEFWGSLRAAEAAVLERRLDEIGADAPPGSGSATERRADALVALAAGGIPGASAPIVITVIAGEATLSGDADQPGYLPGCGPIPAALLREMAEHGKLRPLTPAAQLCTEPRYRPSRALAEFVRCRDLHCRFPGCDAPAEVCDIDHTVPYDQGGPTHPSNLGLLCRAHHLLKTFVDGENGWRHRQFPDGTMEWISPTGHVYTTTPSGAEFFPQLAEPTATLTIDLKEPRARACRTLRMPTRRRSRAMERTARINWERGLNEARWAADPPPF